MGYEKNHSHPLTLRDMGFLFYSGLMRGAIALGLVLRIQSDFANREVIVTTCLALVVFTTIFFGSTTALVGKLFLPQLDSLECQEFEDEDSDTSRKEIRHINEATNEQSALHDTLLPRINNKKRPKKLKCGDYWKRLDEYILRPIFIHKYERTQRSKAYEFFDLLMNEGKMIKNMQK